jgi:hypothetical protein
MKTKGKMKKINNRWHDENNNSWSDVLETKESAQMKREELHCVLCPFLFRMIINIQLN